MIKPMMKVSSEAVAWRLAQWLALAMVLLFFVVSGHLPFGIHANAAHDDAWYWQHGQSLVAGHWQGDFSQYALMKGPGYPLFLAINHLSGLPLSISHALLYCIACGLLVRALYRATGMKWIMLILFIVLLWHPAALSWGRVVRDCISASQVMLLLACLIHAFYLPETRRRGLCWAAGAGLVWAWFWLTREDGIWLLPGVGLMLFVRLLQIRKDRMQLRHAGERLAMFTSMSMLFFLLIATANASKYGRFELVDFRSSPYRNALASLQSIRVGEVVPYVPVPSKVREAVYEVSPTFATLEPYFEGAGRGWTNFGCSVYPTSCGDYAGGWFVWAFRDAVASVGGYESAQKAAGVYEGIHAEIQAACRSGKLQCKRGFIGFMPGVAADQWKTLPASMRAAVSILMWKKGAPGAQSSTGPDFDKDAMWNFVGRPQPWVDEKRAMIHASGWFHTRTDAWLQVNCKSRPGAIPVRRDASPDVANHFQDPGAGNHRFSVSLDTTEDCELETISAEGLGDALRMNILPTGTQHHSLRLGELHFDRVDFQKNEALKTYSAAQQLKVGVERAYRAILPGFSVIGLLAFVFSIFAGILRRRFSTLTVVAAVAWCIVASRVVVLSLVDISAFPAMHVQYMQPAFPILVLASIASLAGFLQGRLWMFRRAPEGDREHLRDQAVE